MSNKASWELFSYGTKVIKAIYGEDGNLNKDVSDYLRFEAGEWGEHAVLARHIWYEGWVSSKSCSPMKSMRSGLGRDDLTLWLRFLVETVMRKISFLVDYRTMSDVTSYENEQVWLRFYSDSIQLNGVLEGVYYGLWWYMWNFRNKLLFDKKIPEKALIFNNLVSSSFYWCKFRCKASFKWDDWLKNPYIVLV
ncbi:hypothetical protein Tco_0478554 [Tanacetum coccineum]